MYLVKSYFHGTFENIGGIENRNSVISTLHWKTKKFTHNVEKLEIPSHLKNISSNQLFSDLFSKTVTFTKYFPRFSVISTLFYSHRKIIRQINYFSISFVKNIAFTEIFVRVNFCNFDAVFLFSVNALRDFGQK